MDVPGCSLTRPTRLQRQVSAHPFSPLNSFPFCIYKNPQNPPLQPLYHLHLQTPPPLTPSSSAFTKSPGYTPLPPIQSSFPNLSTHNPSKVQRASIRNLRNSCGRIMYPSNIFRINTCK